MEEIPSSNSDWNMKQAMRSAKLGISASSYRNCSGLSSGTSGLLDTCSRMTDNSSSVALCKTLWCLTETDSSQSTAISTFRHHTELKSEGIRFILSSSFPIWQGKWQISHFECLKVYWSLCSTHSTF
jgi:hypothetical protein